MSKDFIPENLQDPEYENDDEKLEDAFLEMQLIYKSRVVDVPLPSSVTVKEIPKKDE